jgi:hypothetical protein
MTCWDTWYRHSDLGWPGLAGVFLLLFGACQSHGQAGPGSSASSSSSLDPVAGSEGDTTLLGVDADGDGVRDDVGAYITTLEADPQKRMVLLAFARESTAMMVLGGTGGTSKAAALAQASRVGRTIDCLHDLYSSDLGRKKTILEDIRDALYDNALRLGAYNHASTLVSGTLLQGGHGCDPAITGTMR